MSKLKPTVTNWIYQREYGNRQNVKSTDKFWQAMYTSLLPCSSWTHGGGSRSRMHGGIFNLEFSPDGSLLVAACENKSVLMFDPLSRKLISANPNAHTNCVNCVKFLDSRVFATCSDDSTVSLWDARNLNSRVKTLHGHNNWVKNIEYSKKDSLLVTSGFDGSIYTWDINSNTEGGFTYTRVFHTNGLMRTRLTPDASKLIICTTGGYLMVIHKLDLNTLASDLEGFKPNMFRLMQQSNSSMPAASDYIHLFARDRKSNQVELISDFPVDDEAEVVSSLQVHPQAWCVLSRNITNDETSEWTCVHDIQEMPQSEEVIYPEFIPPRFVRRSVRNDCLLDHMNFDQVRGNGSRSLTERFSLNPSRSDDNSLLTRQFNSNRFGSIVPSNVELQSSTQDVWEALVAIQEARIRRERERNSGIRMRVASIRAATSNFAFRRSVELSSSDGTRNNNEPSIRVSLHNRLPANSSSSSSSSMEDVGFSNVINVSPLMQEHDNDNNEFDDEEYNIDLDDEDRDSGNPRVSPRLSEFPGGRIHVRSSDIFSSLLSDSETDSVSEVRVSEDALPQNIRRLTHYIKEPNVGKGFIKELCFSSDGRLICSPFGFGVRMLAFSQDCSELSNCVPTDPPMQLVEIATTVPHTDIVVCTKFSPTHCLFVSGCLGGKVVWHQPVL